jgi:ribonuclease HII
MIGIDEVGRGCWAGPLLVVAARERSILPQGLNDSKKLSRKSRESLKIDIEIVCDIGEGWVTPAEIDALGLAQAMRLAVARALEKLGARRDEKIIMDGTVNYCSPEFINVHTEPRADGSYPIVSAASIYAKVIRDQFMASLDTQYAVYEFAKHVGYGTALHQRMLQLHGPSDMHRLSFAPIKKLATL